MRNSSTRPARLRARDGLTICAPGVELLETRCLLSGNPLLDLSSLRSDPNQFVDGRILVQVRSGDTDGPGSMAFAGTGWSAVQSIGGGLWQVDLPSGVSVDQALSAYGNLADVAFTQPDYIVSIAATPNDPRYSSLYGLHNTGQTNGVADADIDAPEAWDIHRGSGNTIVGVIDSGIDYNHPDLAANMWRNAGEISGNGVDDDGNGYIDDIFGYDFANNDGNPMDDNGHGTHVAGTIGAVGNNGVGVIGVNWSVKLMALKFLSASGSGSTSNAVRAIRYAVRMGAHITNNSWGGGGADTSLSTAIAEARQAGQIFVAAAGNEANNNDSRASYPANYNYDNVVSVGATDSRDLPASFSNYGATTVDLFAPGVGILSTTPNNTYSTFSGTSMAAPHVAGALALLRDLNPQLSHSQLIARLKSSVDVLSSLQGKANTSGRLNVAKLLLEDQPPVDTTGARVTSAVFTGTNSSSFNLVRLTFSEAIQAASLTAADIQLTAPGGAQIAATSITKVSDTVFDVGFAAQSAGGTYRLSVGPDVQDLANNAMNQDQDATNGEDPEDRFTATHALSTSYTASNNTRLAIRDLATVTSSITVSTALTLSDVNVRVNLTHTYDGDLVLTLIGPDGTRILLANRRGGSGDNYTGTVFDSQASSSITQGRAPFTGTFRPEGALDGLNGKSSRGTWKLEIRDAAARDVGTLTSWSITFQGTPAATATNNVRITPASTSLTDGSLFVSFWETLRGEAPPTRGQQQLALDVQPSVATSSAILSQPTAPPSVLPLGGSRGQDNQGTSEDAGLGIVFDVLDR